MPLAKVNGVALYYEDRVLVYNCRGYPPSTVPSGLTRAMFVRACPPNRVK